MKELTESWAELGEKIRAGDFSGIHVGDYKPYTLPNGEAVNMVVDSIHPCGNCRSQADDRHITFISQGCITGEIRQGNFTQELMQKVMEDARNRPWPPFGKLEARLAFSM